MGTGTTEVKMIFNSLDGLAEDCDDAMFSKPWLDRNLDLIDDTEKGNPLYGKLDTVYHMRKLITGLYVCDEIQDDNPRDKGLSE